MIARSEGSYHWTPEDRRLADFTSGVLVANLGHNPAAWWRRVLGYMSLGNLPQGEGFVAAQPLTSYNALTELEVRAAERLVSTLRRQAGGARMEQVVWAASGSEAIQKALWAAMSRRAGQRSDPRHALWLSWQERAVVRRDRQRVGCRARRARPFHRFSARGVHRRRQRRRQPIDLEPYAAELSALWNEFGGGIAALVTEPYLGGGGSYHPQPAYLQLLERFCRDHDIVFILDEVQSNFGRTGELFAFSHYGIEPDIVVLGKGLGNGIPVDAVVGRADLFAGLHYGEVSDTWSGHPLGCAAVLATLDEFESGDGHRPCPGAGRSLGKRALPPGRARRGGPCPRRGSRVGCRVRRRQNHSAADVAAACVNACYLGDSKGSRDPPARAPGRQGLPSQPPPGYATGRGPGLSRRHVRHLSSGARSLSK